MTDEMKSAVGEILSHKIKSKVFPGVYAFYVYTTYGLPLEVQQAMIDHDLSHAFLRIDEDEFNYFFSKHQEISNHSAAKMFRH